MLSVEGHDRTKVMNQSWKRCQDFGLAPSDPWDDNLLSETRIRELLDQRGPIVKHAEQVFERMSSFIKQTKQIAMLIDAEGHIVHSVGDPDFSCKAGLIQLKVGANWEERRKGTNAIGIALAEKMPIRVHAGEHYFVSHHFLTCASSPVFGTNGELLGVVNISGKQENFHDHSLMIASLAADSLQNRLIVEDSMKEHLITLKELDYTARNHPMPLLTLDKDNRIIRANQAALHVVGRDAIGKEFNSHKGFAVETIQDYQGKSWRSVAIRKPQSGDKHLYTFEDIVGSCPSILQRKELAYKAALTDFPVLLLGESGTGKELFAQSIHTAGPRRDQPFIAVNCSAIPDSLVESELFGYERGAFTGANREGQMGKFSAAHKGTLFLDEIGDMSLRAQAALLRVLQEGILTPVGSVKERSVDVRIIAATNRNLTEEVQEGRFRADLYYRLKGIQVTLPPLRERKDLLMLVHALLEKNSQRIPLLTEAAQRKLLDYHWPGNIRELNSVLVQATFLSDGGSISPEHLPIENIDQRLPAEDRSDVVTSLQDAEIAAIKQALRVTEWNVRKAADLLKIGRTTLYRKIEEYGIVFF
ncbi:sigma-54-dependent Fis family transcriptional regulator [Paenibacillus baekrokdamisoli]|uniref:Sigma-54-dependent Fis family transcriptional regulator n=1 Tax=Paenibacillus baekrokdamisoli TaxID=1712516 RepID=A0A3G9IVE8_9BACL|nr:sigma-54-dependent Fis family transcriptional regulator [Paenibacillus baekrokdamisoli]MBB3070726.1 transcriptional regulator of acetoin/glycerol metabolism [Paenibacillus baekrokdamisoli]BBH20075.1 sigma-54-dependent Fis family transcriptional regulator [Paenibacillus baekrokdamisoli]